MSRSIITISFLQAVFCLAFFTVLSPGIDDIRFEYIPIREGSANETVTGIVQDSQGFMWFGTRYGLFKYDGKRFTAYRHNPGDNNSLASDVILHLLYDHLGNIWIATAKGGMDRLDTSNNRFSHFTFPAVKKEQEKDNTVENIIIDHDKTLWTSTTSGNLYTFDQSTNAFSRFLPADIEQDLYKEPHILNVFEDSTNNFWLSIEDAGPVILDLVKKTLSIAGFAEEQGFGPSLWGGAWLLEDNQQIMWARARGGGLLKYDLKTKKLSGARDSIIPAGIYVNCMVEDSFGHLWIGTADAGVYRYEPVSGRIISFRHNPVNPHSLSSNRILSLFVDKSGTIWVGTQKGLNKYSYFKHKFNFTNNDSIRSDDDYSYVTSLFEDLEGTLWVGTIGGGLNRYEKEVLTPGTIDLATINEQTGTTVHSIFEDSTGALFFGVDEGLLRYDRMSNSFTRLTEPQQITDIHEDKQGNLWIAAYIKGLGRFVRDNNTITYFKPRSDAKMEPETFDARVIFEDRVGNLWVGSEGDGLIKLLPDRVTYLHYLHNPEIASSLSDNRIYAIHQDDNGYIWIGTGFGLNKLEPQSGSFVHFYDDDGLPDNMICGILSDERENLWISTYNGLVKFNPETGKIVQYDQRDGLQDNQFHPGAYFKSRENMLYFGGVNGFISFDPEQLPINHFVPNIVITSVRKAGKRVNIDLYGDGNDVLRLPYNENRFTIDFAALDFTEPRKNQYSYILEGYEEEWTDSGNRAFADYTRVAPGDYTFRVKGSNNDAVWNESGATMRIVVSPPFWMTWEFRTLIVVIIIISIIAAHKLRTRSIHRQRNLLQKEVDERRIAEARLLNNQERLRSLASELTVAEERERHRISQVLHDQIGQSLMMSKAKLDKHAQSNTDEASNPELNKVREILNGAIKDTRSLTVEVSPPSLHKFGLEAAVESLVKKFGDENGINTVYMRGKPCALNEDVSILLYQAIRELLINVFKHARASAVKINIEREDGNVFVTIQDNGKGFDVNKTLQSEDDFKGFGLYSIQERLESIGGKMIISSVPGKGTNVKLNAPLSEQVEG